MATNRVRVSISFDPKLLRRIDRLAKRAGDTRSGLIASMIEDQLAETEAVLKITTNEPVMSAFAKAFAEPGVMGAMAKALGERVEDQEAEMLVRMFKAAAAEGAKGQT